MASKQQQGAPASAPTIAEEQAIVPAEVRTDTVAKYISKMEPQIAKALAGSFDPEAFGRIVLTEIQNSPKLQKCNMRSILGCMMQAAQVRLPLDKTLGLAYMIPRRVEGKWEAQFQLGYKGARTLMYRSAATAALRCNVVREGEHFEWEDGLRPHLVHRPGGDPSKKIVAAWAVVETTRGGLIPWVMSEAEILRVEARSDAAKRGKGPWKHADDRAWMSMKSCIVRVAKLAPLELELQRAFALDELADAGERQGLGDALDVEFRVAEKESGRGSELPSERFKQAFDGGDELDSGGEDEQTMDDRYQRLAEQARGLFGDGADRALQDAISEIAGNFPDLDPDQDAAVLAALQERARKARKGK